MGSHTAIFMQNDCDNDLDQRSSTIIHDNDILREHAWKSRRRLRTQQEPSAAFWVPKMSNSSSICNSLKAERARYPDSLARR